MPNRLCDGCGKTIQDGRRYPVEPLAEFLGTSVNQACHKLDVSGTTQQDARCHGFTRVRADSLAAKLKEHTSAIWPEVVDHDIEDASIPCDDCGEPFIPRNKSHRFCRVECGRRWRSRRWHRERYNSDPEFRAKALEYAARYRAECASSLAKYRRRYKERNRERLAQAEREYRARNRDRIRERDRLYYQANRERLLEKQRKIDARRRDARRQEKEAS